MSTYNKQHQQINMSIAAQITQYNKSKNCRKPEVKIDTITDKKIIHKCICIYGSMTSELLVKKN